MALLVMSAANLAAEGPNLASEVSDTGVSFGHIIGPGVHHVKGVVGRSRDRKSGGYGFARGSSHRSLTVAALLGDAVVQFMPDCGR
jgi:hypothetical protein